MHEFHYWLKIAIFFYSLSFSDLDRGDLFRIDGKALLILIPETRVIQVADGKDLMILACTVFD